MFFLNILTLFLTIIGFVVFDIAVYFYDYSLVSAVLLVASSLCLYLFINGINPSWNSGQVGIVTLGCVVVLGSIYFATVRVINRSAQVELHKTYKACPDNYLDAQQISELLKITKISHPAFNLKIFERNDECRSYYLERALYVKDFSVCPTIKAQTASECLGDFINNTKIETSYYLLRLSDITMKATKMDHDNGEGITRISLQGASNLYGLIRKVKMNELWAMKTAQTLMQLQKQHDESSKNFNSRGFSEELKETVKKENLKIQKLEKQFIDKIKKKLKDARTILDSGRLPSNSQARKMNEQLYQSILNLVGSL